MEPGRALYRLGAPGLKEIFFLHFKPNVALRMKLGFVKEYVLCSCGCIEFHSQQKVEPIPESDVLFKIVFLIIN